MNRARRLVIFITVAAFIFVGAVTAFAGFFETLTEVANTATDSIQDSQTKAPATKRATTKTTGGSILNLNEYYAGYSKDFQNVKADIESGKVEKAYQSRQKIAKDEKEEPNVLFAWEQSLMALDSKQRAQSIQYLEISENLLADRKKRSAASDSGNTALTEVIKFVGFDEYGEYEGEAFERILMLNFKSIAYMLNGDRKAYNVTRRSIDWQNDEKKAFDKKMALVKKELKKEEKTQSKTNPQGGGDFNAISELFKSSESQALKVPSAFVNPFGFYMAGMVQEYDSYQDPSLRSNARISYKKALELNPKSDVIKQALKSIKKKQPKGKRLIHIIVADGFAPEKMVARFDLPIVSGMIPIKIPIYVQDESRVAKIQVQNSKGTCLATLSKVADIDAITMRHQYDSLPEQRLRLMLTVGRSIAESKVAESAGIFGLIGKAIRDETTNPDMRSWMGLPKQILAARLFLPPGSGNLKLVSLDAKGRVLTEKKLTLRENDHNFIYARSFDKVLYINQSEKLWVKI